MCGRFTLKTLPSEWGQFLLPGLPWNSLASGELSDWQPRYNIAPTQSIVTLVRYPSESLPSVMKCRWGLVPSWADDLAIGNRMINARSETLTEKPSFRSAIAKRRCIVVADGYYEWQKSGGKGAKQPYWIHRPGEPVFAMAGLWERNKKATGAEVLTATIITTSANQALTAIHDRMPAIIAADKLEAWLDPEMQDGSSAQSMLHPSPDSWFEYKAVSTRVNSPKHDAADCLATE